MIGHGELSLSVWLVIFDISKFIKLQIKLVFIFLIFSRKLPQCLTQVKIGKVKQPENKAYVDGPTDLNEKVYVHIYVIMYPSGLEPILKCR